jgi:hypothetical protein
MDYIKLVEDRIYELTVMIENEDNERELKFLRSLLHLNENVLRLLQLDLPIRFYKDDSAGELIVIAPYPMMALS